MKIPSFSHLSFIATIASATLAMATAATAQSPSPAPPIPGPTAAPAVKYAAPAEAAKLLADAAKSPDKAITVIDVRSPEEYAEGHLKGAQNMDIASPDFRKSLSQLDPAKTYLVHCAAGGRSTRCLSVLNQLGYKSIIHLDGGLNAWKAANLPIEKPTSATPPQPK